MKTLATIAALVAFAAAGCGSVADEVTLIGIWEGKQIPRDFPLSKPKTAPPSVERELTDQLSAMLIVTLVLNADGSAKYINGDATSLQDPDTEKLAGTWSVKDHKLHLALIGQTSTDEEFEWNGPDQFIILRDQGPSMRYIRVK